MIVKLLTEHHFDFLSLKGGCRGWSESTHVKMPHCWKSHALAQYIMETYHEPRRLCLFTDQMRLALFAEGLSVIILPIFFNLISEFTGEDFKSVFS